MPVIATQNGGPNVTRPKQTNPWTSRLAGRKRKNNQITRDQSRNQLHNKKLPRAQKQQKF